MTTRHLSTIATIIETEGYSNLTDDEIELYVTKKAELAANQALTSKKSKSIDEIMKNSIENSNKMCEKAMENFDNVVSQPLVLKKVVLDEQK